MTKQASIWDFQELLEPSVPPQYQLTLGEGQTPLQEIEGLYFKREDLNPTGSIKDRGMAYQLSRLIQEGHSQFTLSSSGNAAISAATYLKQAGKQLTAFISDNIDESKLKVLHQLSVTIIKDPRPVSSAFRFAKQHNYYNLRPSKDPYGSTGYQTIAYELAQQLHLHNLNNKKVALYAAVSSGTFLRGMYQGFEKQNLLTTVSLYAVQTSTTHSIASAFDFHFDTEKHSIASGIVAKTTPHKSFLVNNLSGGFIVNNHQIEQAYNWLQKRDMRVSYDSAVALAGKLKHGSFSKDTLPVIILSGKQR